MKSKIAVVFALVCLTTVNCGLVGGWEKIASDSAEVTEVLESFWPQVTDYLVNTTGRPFHHKLMQIAKVKTQVVAGMKYRYTFDIAPTKCPITDELTKEQVNQCGLDETEVVRRCTFTVLVQDWLNNRQILDKECRFHFLVHDYLYAYEME